jgi:RNA polymerase sigma factor (sigma-70 family)
LDLYTQFADMVPPIAERLKRRLPPSIDVEDLMQAGRFALFLACEEADCARSETFGAYVRMRVLGAMLDLVRVLYREATHEQLPPNTTKNHVDIPSYIQTSKCPSDPFLARAIASLRPRHRVVIEMRFCDGLSQFETAAALGVSQTTARNIERSAIRAIRCKLGIAA